LKTFSLRLWRSTAASIRPSTVLDDLERGPGGITNADDLFLGPLLPRVRPRKTRANVPAVDLLARLGMETGLRPVFATPSA